jgi:predicted dehydrogenase
MAANVPQATERELMRTEDSESVSDSNRDTDEMKSIRWGILGCGDIAQKRVAEAIQLDPNSELVAACRRDATKLNEFCARFGVGHAYVDSRDLIESDAIDAVYVATPVYLHRQNVVDAAKAGKHVIVEKPMAMTTTECDEMIRACRDAGVKLSVAYYRRFYPIVHRMKELIASGELGIPLSINASTGNQTQFPKDDWRVVLSQGGGGPLMDIGSHRLDLFLDMFGPVESVKSCIESIASNYEAEDAAALLLKFQSGPIGILQTHFGASNVPDFFAVVCTQGSMFTGSLNGGELRILQDDKITIEQHPPHRNLHAPLIADFSDSLRNDREPMVTSTEGRDVNRVIELAYRG